MNATRAGLLAATTLLAACIVQSMPMSSTPTPQAPARDEVRIFAELVNQHREKHGCKPLAWSADIAEVARAHSADMAAQGYFGHTNLLGETPFDRLRKANIAYRRAAENIAEGQQTAEQVLASWLSSSGHRRNIEDCAFTQHGVGMVMDRWTHVFVTP